MTLNAALRLMAGTVILASLALGYTYSENWYYLTGFVGLNMLQSAFTGWCPAVTIFKMIGLKAEQCSVDGMTVNQGVHMIAGILILGTTSAVVLMDMPQEILFATAVIGASLLQSAFSGWCLAFTISRLIGFKDTTAAS
ncbi:MAG: DUF2892 domain-containing protein [Marinobacterium sp.]|nr:DUF2892 domain-containing protein [Marinobacterium sp.]